MRINTNFSSGSMSSQYLGAYGSEIEKSISRISSGLRVAQPSEDTASYFKAESLKSRSESTKSVSRSLEEHVARVQSAEGYLKEVKTMLDDMAELALKASNEDTEALRVSYGKEYDAKKDALTKFLDGATYQGESLLKGAYDSNAGGTAKSAQVDEDPSATKYSYDILDTRFDESTGLNLSGSDDAVNDWAGATGKTKAANYHKALTKDDSGSTRVERNITRVGTHLSVLNGSKNALEVKAQNYEAASSALVSVDDAEESTRLSNLQIRRQVAASFFAQNNIQQGQVIGLITQVGIR